MNCMHARACLHRVCLHTPTVPHFNTAAFEATSRLRATTTLAEPHLRTRAALATMMHVFDASQGVPGHACCLHELLEHATQHLEPELHRLLSSMQAAASAATSAGAHGTDAGSDLGIALVKLDHLHNRPLYVKTLSNWAKELCLTGRPP